MKKRKNRSQQIKDGQVGQTTDTELYSGIGYKGKSVDRPFNRPVIMVATNRKNEVAIVKVTHTPKGKKIRGGFRGDTKATFRPYVETKDKRRKPLKANKQVKMTGENVGKTTLRDILTKCFRGNKSYAYENRKRVRIMKGRKKPIKARKHNNTEKYKQRK